MKDVNDIAGVRSVITEVSLTLEFADLSVQEWGELEGEYSQEKIKSAALLGEMKKRQIVESAADPAEVSPLYRTFNEIAEKKVYGDGTASAAEYRELVRAAGKIFTKEASGNGIDFWRLFPRDMI